jgi:hypothetical protein
VSATKRDFAIWKTAKLGTCKTADDYRKALKKARYGINIWANEILNKAAFTFTQQETEVDLVVLSVGELGFKDGAHYNDICARAVEMGLELCPAEVGPTLRLAYADQPKNECLRIATEAIIDSDGYLFIFAVEHVDGELWLRGYFGHPASFWYAVHRFVFVRRK